MEKQHNQISQTQPFYNRIPKINSIHYGGAWIGLGILLGGIIPGILRLILGWWCWPLVIAGAVVLVAFMVLFAIEMAQDNGRIPHYEGDLKNKVPFDPKTQYAVMRCSICTGEQVAGFRSREDSHFTDVMLIQSEDDLERFKSIYGITEVKKEY